MDRRASGPAKAVRFNAPETASPVRTRSGRILTLAVCLGGVACAALAHGDATWPSPAPAFAVVVLASLVAIANLYGTYQTVGGLTEFTSLAMPIGFAMVLLLDWRRFVLAVVLGEIFTFVSESARRKNPTMWYLRIFNACVLTIAGAAAATLLGALRPIEGAAIGDPWLSPGLAIALFFAAVAYKVVETVAPSTLVALSAGESIGSIRVPIRTFASQLALFLIAIPFARLWSENALLSLFALAPLGVAYRLLGIPELEHRVRVDARTGLTNAGAFDAIFEDVLEDARQRKREVALLAIDIDHFKRINDSFGHLIGDAVIARFATILADLTRRDDVAARIGGEEFALLVRGAGHDDALALAERVRERVEGEWFEPAGEPSPRIALTASIGVAIYPADGTDSRDLYAAADAALYRAKESGRNAVRSVRSAAQP